MRTVRRCVIICMAALTLAGAGVTTVRPACAQGVVPPPPPPPLRGGDPYQTLQGFAQSPARGVWPRLNKARILQEIQTRLRNPYAVNQGSQGVCGPAALTFALVVTNPAAYVRYCWRLFEDGLFGERGFLYEAPPSLLSRAVPLGIDQVDWMLMATMGEHYVPVVGDAILPFDMGMGIKYLLGYDSTDWIKVTPTRAGTENTDAILKARAVLNRGGVAMLMIDHHLITGGWFFQPKPDHWVVLMGPINPGRSLNGQVAWVDFDFYSWARRYQGRLYEMPSGPVDAGGWHALYAVVTGQH